MRAGFDKGCKNCYNKFMIEKDPSPHQEPQQIGEVIEELGGINGIAGAELPTGRTKADQLITSLDVEVGEISAARQDTMERIKEEGSNPQLKEDLEKTSQELLDAQIDRAQAKQDTDKP